MSTDSATIERDESVNRISSAIFGDELQAPTETPGVEEVVAQEAPVQETPEVVSVPEETVKTYDVPKSWKKEMHEHWGKVDPAIQGYLIEREEQLLNGFKQFNPIKDALSPHLEYLNQQNIQAPYAIDSLLRAHRLLTEGTLEQRQAYYKQLGENLKIVQAATDANGEPPNPEVEALRKQVLELQSAFAEKNNREIETTRQSVQKEVEAFAADTKAHPYFDEVSQDIAGFVQMGLSLQDAYDKAVWANPTTRAKEQARLLTEHEAKLKENARLSALPKKQAKGVNLKSDGDGAAPTEPLGSLEDTIRSTHKAMKARVS